MEKRTRITLYPRNIVIWLSTITILLVAAHLITIATPYIFEGFEHGLVRLLFSLFFLDGEGNVPALFSTCLFLINAAIFPRLVYEPGKVALFFASTIF